MPNMPFLMPSCNAAHLEHSHGPGLALATTARAQVRVRKSKEIELSCAHSLPDFSLVLKQCFFWINFTL